MLLKTCYKKRPSRSQALDEHISAEKREHNKYSSVLHHKVEATTETARLRYFLNTSVHDEYGERHIGQFAVLGGVDLKP